MIRIPSRPIGIASAAMLGHREPHLELEPLKGVLLTPDKLVVGSNNHRLVVVDCSNIEGARFPEKEMLVRCHPKHVIYSQVRKNRDKFIIFEVPDKGEEGICYFDDERKKHEPYRYLRRDYPGWRKLLDLDLSAYRERFRLDVSYGDVIDALEGLSPRSGQMLSPLATASKVPGENYAEMLLPEREGQPFVLLGLVDGFKYIYLWAPLTSEAPFPSREEFQGFCDRVRGLK